MLGWILAKKNLIEGLGPVLLRDWDSSHFGVGNTEVLGSILAKKDHIEGLGPGPLRGWDQSCGGVGTGTVGSSPTEVLG